MNQAEAYEIGLNFMVEARRPASRKPLHRALGSIRGIVVDASSFEEAEAHVDQIRMALEEAAARRDSIRDIMALNPRVRGDL
jgi:hypothetical protein